MLKFHTLDVFTTDPYAGNPLAIVLGADDLSTEQMQIIAREFNLSETIFVQKPDVSAHSAKVRIFFPTAEIPFAGHPTVGCAILLAEMQNGLGDFRAEITLEEVAGLVPVTVIRMDGVTTAEFTAPVIPHAHGGKLLSRAKIAAALGLTAADIGFGGHTCGVLQGGPSFIYVPVLTRDALSKAWPNDPEWAALTKQAQCNSVYLYTANGENSFTGRMFAPGDGIPEDPATGSASAILAAQLLASGVLHDGTNEIKLEQGIDMGRKSSLEMSVDVQDDVLTAIRIAGTAIRISQGEILALPLETEN